MLLEGPSLPIPLWMSRPREALIITIPGPALVFTGTQNEVQFITVPIIDDLVDENINEDFTVQLGIPTNGVGLSGGGDARAESSTMT